MVQAPWELVARVRINGLEQAQNNPAVHGQDVEILENAAVDDWSAYGTESEQHNLNWRCVFGSKTERGGILVVNLVDHLVQWTPVKSAVEPVVPCIFKNEENCDLKGHHVERREWNVGLKSKVLGERVKKPDLGQLNGKVTDQDKLCAIPLFSCGRDFVLWTISESCSSSSCATQVHTC